MQGKEMQGKEAVDIGVFLPYNEDNKMEGVLS
jgi:hypothetical protein